MCELPPSPCLSGIWFVVLALHGRAEDPPYGCAYLIKERFQNRPVDDYSLLGIQRGLTTFLWWTHAYIGSLVWCGCRQKLCESRTSANLSNLIVLAGPLIGFPHSIGCDDTALMWIIGFGAGASMWLQNPAQTYQPCWLSRELL
jgi:hypothetical protein